MVRLPCTDFYCNTAKYYLGEKSSFLHIFLNFLNQMFKVKFKNIWLSMLNVFKKKLISMYGKPATTCFKYQVYLSSLEAITYFFLKVWWHAASLFIYYYINRAYIQYFIYYTRRMPFLISSLLLLGRGPPLGCRAQACRTASWRAIIWATPHPHRTHHIIERYTLSGYRACHMSHQTAPPPHYRQPSPLCKTA